MASLKADARTFATAALPSVVLNNSILVGNSVSFIVITLRRKNIYFILTKCAGYYWELFASMLLKGGSIVVVISLTLSRQLLDIMYHFFLLILIQIFLLLLFLGIICLPRSFSRLVWTRFPQSIF